MNEYNNPWFFNNKPLETEDIINYVGMVYLITNINKNKKYIGKKFFWTKKTKTVKGKKKKIPVESDWKIYYGSNKELLEDIKNGDNVRREVLRLCKSKTECAYYEIKEQIDTQSILKKEFYNEYVGCRVKGSNLKKTEGIL